MKATHTKALIVAALAALIFCSTLVHAKGPVWKVSKGEQFIYLGGTIHVLSQKDYPLPEEFEEAYSESDTLVFETDISVMADPKTQAKLLQVMIFQDDRTLASQLSLETMQELEVYFLKRNIPMANFSKFTPAGLSLTLTVLEMQLLGLGVTSGVDQFYSLRGINDGKAIEALETMDEQLAFIDGLNNSDGDEMIRSTLKDVATLSEMWGSMLSAWREGDMAALGSIGLEPMEKEFPEITALLLETRNKNWMKALPAMFADEDVEFVLVGSLHIVGEKGLLSMLSKAGYTVEQLD